MNWLIFAIAAYLAYALDTGLRVLLSSGGVSPSFLLILAVYLGLLAPHRTVIWSYLVLGILTDLQGVYTAEHTVLGPAALGYLVGAYAVLQLRGMVFRESIITVSVLSFAAGIFIHLTMLAILKFRALVTGEPMMLSAADALVQGFLHLLYTAAAAVPVGFILLRTTPMWGFPGKVRLDRYH